MELKLGADLNEIVLDIAYSSLTFRRTRSKDNTSL